MTDPAHVDDGRAFAATSLPLTLPLCCGGVTFRTDQAGMVPAKNTFGGGLYLDDTRHLSTAIWTIGGQPLRLVPANQPGGYMAQFRYGNTPFRVAGGSGVPPHHLRVKRELLLHEGSLYETLVVANSHPEPLVVDLKYEVGMDAAHMFHVRGFAFDPKARGQILRPVMARTAIAPAVVFRYQTGNGLWVHTVLEFLARRERGLATQEDQQSDAVSGTCRLTYRFKLNPGKCRTVELRATPLLVRTEPLVAEPVLVAVESPTPKPPHIDAAGTGNWSFATGLRSATAAYRSRQLGHARITTSNRRFNRLLATAELDLHTLWLDTGEGSTWAAGNPWYMCPFGRDSAITAGQVLPFMLDEVREVLRFHARHLGTRRDQYRAQHIGKAFHEKRGGELAWLGLIPHGTEPYFGTIDATPLFMRLFATYVVATGDLEFARQLWPQIKLSLAYIEQELERGKGWLVYGLDPEQALSHQGWKDSEHGIRRGDGSPTRHPIALVEVQAYLYEALVKIARVCEALASDTADDYSATAANLRKTAEELKARFLEKFTTPDGCFLALALDSQGPSGVSDLAEHQVLTVTTNAGHALSTGILPDDLAKLVGERLGRRDVLHRWGLVATASSTRWWNPEGYHDGIWVWDNSEVVKGLSAVGCTDLAHQIIQRQFGLVRHTPDGRLPELVCGYNSRQHRPWPQACVPQAWSSGAPYQWLASMLGLHQDGLDGVLHLINPSLPSFLNWVAIDNLRVGQKTVGLRFQVKDGRTYASLTSNPDGVPIMSRGCAVV